MTLKKRSVTMYCVDGGVIRSVDPLSASLVREARELPPEDQCRLLKVLRHIAAKSWPYQLEEVTGWNQKRFRRAVDALPEPPVHQVA